MKAEREHIRLYHGSPVQVPAPRFGVGNPRNDYGLGFYCTEQHDLACEWACPTEKGGFANRYALDMTGLELLDLQASPYGTLSWIATLVANRRFEATTPLVFEAKRFLMSEYSVDLTKADVVTGYRADDSYFSFARAFLDNRLPLRQLDEALRLGNLGTQVVLISPRAFEALAFEGAEAVEGSIWHARRWARDSEARAAYRAMVVQGDVRLDDVFVLDLMRAARWPGLTGGA